jgi:rod shape determining protein RodA
VKHRRKNNGWIAAFLIFSAILCQGCDYVFHNILQPHQRVRIEVLLGMKDDPHGAGYNVNQSLIAIGSGQFAGKGYLQGTQTKLKFVPEQDTDFIFCTVGEEWGFLGSAGLLMLYLALILRIIHLAERQRDAFSRIYIYSVASILLFHVTINIGMVLGLLPVIGIPLPFFSYGGSSLWGFTILLSIMLRLDAARVNKLHG